LKYKYCITKIATEIKRSLEAHAAVGFMTVQSYVAEENGIRWELGLWDWRANNHKASSKQNGRSHS
jgi:hypothetical protein